MFSAFWSGYFIGDFLKDVKCESTSVSPWYLFALHYGAGTVAREGSGTTLMNNLVLINFKLKWREIENDYCQSKHA